MRTNWLFAGIAIYTLSAPLFAQTPAAPPLIFEVASIKANPALKAAPSKIANPGGLIYTFVTLSDCIEAAYGIKSQQLSGPEWIRSEHYDITAKATGNPDNGQLMIMLRSLLAERFKLAFHHDQREVPVYSLTVGKGGHRLRPGASEEAAKIQFAAGAISFESASMTDLLQFLAGFRLDRPVMDNTGLAGKFDFKLTVGSPDANLGDMKRALAQSGSSIFMDALAPLGLKLEAQKDLTDVMVVDHAERASVQQ